MTPEIKNVLKNKLHDQIGDISERFYGDILKIIDVVEYPILPVTIVSSSRRKVFCANFWPNPVLGNIFEKSARINRIQKYQHRIF